MSDGINETFENPEAEELLGKAADLFSENKLEAAEIALRQITGKFPNFFPGWASLGDFYLNVGRPDRALAPLRQATRLAFYEGIGHYLLGVAYIKVARFHLAERELEMAGNLLTEKADVRAHLGRAKMMLGNIEEGRKLIAEALRDEPDNPFIKADMAQSYAAEKNYEEALRWAEDIQSDNPFFAENAAELRKLKEGFDRLTSEEQKASKEEAFNKEAGNKMRIEMMLSLADGGNGLTPEDIAEINEEMRLHGLTGQITAIRDPNDPKSKAAIEFVKMHEELGLGMGKKPQKIAPEKIRELEGIVKGGKAVKEKKKAIVLLAFSGLAEALGALGRLLKNPPTEDLKLWIELANDECRLINSGVSEGEPAVIFRNLEDDRA